MTLRDIPGTDLRVSPLCLGTALYGADAAASHQLIDTPTAYSLLDAFVARGGNFIDTARSYNDWIPGERGRSEGLIGRWFADRRNRNHLMLATKGGHASDDGAPRLNARDLGADIDASLRRLRIEAIDLYYLHRDDPTAAVAPIIDALNAHVRAGKIRYLGCSNWSAARIREANDYAAASGQAGFVANQPLWNAGVIEAATQSDRTLTTMNDEMRRMHSETGLACVPYSAQAGGLFTKLQSPWYALRFRLGKGPTGYPSAPNRRRHAALLSVASARQLTITQVVLGYLLSQPFVTVPVVGCRTVDQLVSTMTASDIRLDAADLATIDAAR